MDWGGQWGERQGSWKTAFFIVLLSSRSYVYFLQNHLESWRQCSGAVCRSERSWLSGQWLRCHISFWDRYTGKGRRIFLLLKILNTKKSLISEICWNLLEGIFGIYWDDFLSFDRGCAKLYNRVKDCEQFLCFGHILPECVKPLGKYLKLPWQSISKTSVSRAYSCETLQNLFFLCLT